MRVGILSQKESRRIGVSLGVKQAKRGPRGVCPCADLKYPLAGWSWVMPRVTSAVFDAATPAPASQRIAAASLQLAAVVGREIQTYWDGNNRWFSGRVFEARVGETGRAHVLTAVVSSQYVPVLPP